MERKKPFGKLTEALDQSESGKVHQPARVKCVVSL